MVNIRKIINSRINNLENNPQTFKTLFEIIHLDENYIFCETTNNYKLVTMSYGDIKKKVKQVATVLKRKLNPLKKGCFVGILMENCCEWICCFWGLLMAGYKPLLMNVRLGESLNNEVVKLANNEYVIYDSLVPYMLNNVNMINCHHLMEEASHIDLEISDDFNWADEIALTTSATTLNIKICVYDGKSICEQIKNSKLIVKENSMIKMHYKDNLKLLAFLPFYHIFGLIACYMWFSFFGRTFIFLNDYKSDTITKTCRKHKVTHIFAVPLLWNEIVKNIKKTIKEMGEKTEKKFYKGIELSLKIQNIFPFLGKRIALKIMKQINGHIFGDSVKFCITGGSYIGQETLKIINALGYPLFNGYGMTELGITSVELRYKADSRIDGSIGKPFKSVLYQLNDDNELLVKASSMCTKIISKNENISINKKEFFHTNDNVIVDKNGYYFIVGRKDDIVISVNGEKINPDSIEINMKIDGAKNFCLLGLKDLNDKSLNKNAELCLIIEIAKTRNEIEKKKIANEIEDVITSLYQKGIQVQKVYITYDSIISLNAVKISRTILKKQISNGSIGLIPFFEYKSEVKEDNSELISSTLLLVKELFAEVLKIDINCISDDSHFIYDLGGTSLEFLTLLIRMKEEFHIEFTIQSGNCFYTPRQFTEYII